MGDKVTEVKASINKYASMSDDYKTVSENNINENLLDDSSSRVLITSDRSILMVEDHDRHIAQNYYSVTTLAYVLSLLVLFYFGLGPLTPLALSVFRLNKQII